MTSAIIAELLLLRLRYAAEGNAAELANVEHRLHAYGWTSDNTPAPLETAAADPVAETAARPKPTRKRKA